MKGLNSWAQGIIIAIIITSILQMILPDNKSKKYINVVIGIYILFCIISPVIGKNNSFENVDISEYLNIENSSSQEDTEIYNSNVEETFKNKIIYNIQSQLKAKGYEAEKINVSIDDEYNITRIQITDIYESKEKNKNDSNNTDDNKTNEILINKVETNINTVEIDKDDKKVWRYSSK